MSQIGISLDLPNLVSKAKLIQKGYTWINFDNKSPEREIDIKKSIDLYPCDDFSLVLNSLELTTKKLQLNVAENKSKVNQDQNYLQIGLPDRVFLYDLSFKVPKESFSCFEKHFFIDPQNFVDLGLTQVCTKESSETATWRYVTNCH